MPSRMVLWYFSFKRILSILKTKCAEFESDAAASFGCISAVKDRGVAVFAHDAKGETKGIVVASAAAALGKSADKTGANP